MSCSQSIGSLREKEQLFAALTEGKGGGQTGGLTKAWQREALAMIAGQGGKFWSVVHVVNHWWGLAAGHEIAHRHWSSNKGPKGPKSYVGSQGVSVKE